jgi:hypothetical protein
MGQSNRSFQRLKYAVVGLLVVVMLLIEFADVLTGREWSMWVFYLLPIGVAGWQYGARLSAVLAVLAVTFLVVDAAYNGIIYSRWLIFWYMLACRAGCYLLVGYLSSRAGRVLELENKIRAYEVLCDSLNIDIAVPQNQSYVMSTRACRGQETAQAGQ